MEIRTYRAKSLHQALQWIQSDLGPEAAVLHTRELRSGLMEWLRGRQLEVTAGVGIGVPSRFVAAAEPRGDGQQPAQPSPAPAERGGGRVVPADELDYRGRYRRALREPRDEAPSLVEELSSRSSSAAGNELPESLFQLLTHLTDLEMDDESARELIDRLRSRTAPRDRSDFQLLKSRLARLIEEQISCCGPINVPPDQRRVVAFVGPTGVGKTTTIAKLAANFRLRQHRRVGLVTVDTFRVAAVDQLRTYADIIDLPLEVVSSPRAIRPALARLADMELVLLDTAGQSPWDEGRIQELESLLRDCQADEVQLVVSGVASTSSLKQAMARFAAIGATRVIVTKLDEAACLGHLWPVLRDGPLPLSYITHGQTVPDDFSPADARKLARSMLRLDGGR